MSSLPKTLVVITSVVELLVGLFGNGFIVLINSIDWFRNQKISLVDFILTCLAISRICLLWTSIAGLSVSMLHETIFYSKSLLVAFDIIWTGSNYFCIACTTCLCVFYFFKVANFTNPVFFWIKQRICKVLLIIGLGTILYFIIFLIFMETVTDNFINEWTMEQNVTFNFLDILNDFLAYRLLYNMILIMFFIVCLISFLLLILSLWDHTRRMKLQGIYARDSSTEAHVRAMKFIISFLFFFILHYISNIMIMLAYSILNTIVTKTLAHILIFLYPSGHPILLILWNSKLKQALLCVLKRLACHSGNYPLFQ